MATNYLRCPQSDCKLQRKRKPGANTQPDPADKKYAAIPDPDPTHCKQPGCDCFVVATHIVTKDKETTTDEKIYPGSSKKTDLSDLLDDERQQKEHPALKPDKSNINDYWKISAACLKLDDKGSPQVAMMLEFNLPKRQLLAIKSELIKRFGKSSVKEIFKKG
jgi:hypothetical protein